MEYWLIRDVETIVTKLRYGQEDLSFLGESFGVLFDLVGISRGIFETQHNSAFDCRYIKRSIQQIRIDHPLFEYINQFQSHNHLVRPNKKVKIYVALRYFMWVMDNH